MEFKIDKFAVNIATDPAFVISKDGRYLLFSGKECNLWLYDQLTKQYRDLGTFGKPLNFSEDSKEFMFVTEKDEKNMLTLGSVDNEKCSITPTTKVPKAVYILKDKIIYIRGETVDVLDRKSKAVTHSPHIGYINEQVYCSNNLFIHTGGEHHFLQMDINALSPTKIIPFKQNYKNLSAVFMTMSKGGNRVAWCNAETNDVHQLEAGVTTTISKDKLPTLPKNFSSNILGLRYHENNTDLQLASLNEQNHTVLSLWNKDRCIGTKTLKETLSHVEFYKDGMVGLGDGGISHYHCIQQPFQPSGMDF